MVVEEEKGIVIVNIFCHPLPIASSRASGSLALFTLIQSGIICDGYWRLLL